MKPSGIYNPEASLEAPKKLRSFRYIDKAGLVFFQAVDSQLLPTNARVPSFSSLVLEAQDIVSMIYYVLASLKRITLGKILK